MKLFDKYVTSFLSYYLASAAITAFIMISIALLLVTQDILPNQLSFIFSTTLYFSLLIILTFFYFPHIKQRNYETIITGSLAIIFLHKLLVTAMGSIGGFIINGLHHSISVIVLTNIVVAYFSDHDANPIAMLQVAKIGSIIYIGEAIVNTGFYFARFYNTSSAFDPNPFSNNPNEFIAVQFAYYFGFLLATYGFFLIYPYIKQVCIKLFKFNVLLNVLKILLAPFGIMSILLALIFA